jgi:sodium-dependent dicarboxylate transporter 2/3/5
MKIKIACAILFCIGGIVSWANCDDPLMARAAFLSCIALAFWLTELIPLFVPTFLLITGIPLLLGPIDAAFNLPSVLSWPMQPVMALFFGGFALGAAGHKHGIDTIISHWTAILASASRLRLLFGVMGSTALLSMWMSNVAAAAMMIAALRPLWKDLAPDDSFRRALLLGVAFGANFGGMATPVGSGPNAIAVAAAQIDFLEWMLLALPLMAILLFVSFLLLCWVYRVRGRIEAAPMAFTRPTPQSLGVAAIFTAAVTLWISEPWHGIPAGITALAVAAALFGFGLLNAKDLARLDWATLLLIAGGLTLGELVEQSGLAHAAATAIDWDALPRVMTLAAFVLATALLSALASNTATAALLIPLAMSIVPAPSTAILVAIGASLGVPFVISTPCNALAHGEGGLRPRDFLLTGMPLMIGGCILVSFTGPLVLNWLGFR